MPYVSAGDLGSLAYSSARDASIAIKKMTAELDLITRILCELMRSNELNGPRLILSEEALRWYREHKEADRKAGR